MFLCFYSILNALTRAVRFKLSKRQRNFIVFASPVELLLYSILFPGNNMFSLYDAYLNFTNFVTQLCMWGNSPENCLTSGFLQANGKTILAILNHGNLQYLNAYIMLTKF